MKILAFADVHSNKSVLEKLIKRAKKEKVDLLICAGDISIFENGLEAMIKILGKSGFPVFIINGNHESADILNYVAKKYKNVKFIHKKIFLINEIYLVGYGGGGFSITDSGFEKTANKFSKLLKKKDFILVTHAPPYKTRLDKLGSSHCGNKSIANFIKIHQPLLAISGHLHETEGKKDKIGKTVVINPGMAGMIINL